MSDAVVTKAERTARVAVAREEGRRAGLREAAELAQERVVELAAEFKRTMRDPVMVRFQGAVCLTELIRARADGENHGSWCGTESECWEGERAAMDTSGTMYASEDVRSTWSENSNKPLPLDQLPTSGMMIESEKVARALAAMNRRARRAFARARKKGAPEDEALLAAEGTYR